MRDRALLCDLLQKTPHASPRELAQATGRSVSWVRQSKYLNNVVEQDHRFMKRLTKPGMGFFSFGTALRTLQGYFLSLGCL